MPSVGSETEPHRRGRPSEPPRGAASGSSFLRTGQQRMSQDVASEKGGGRDIRRGRVWDLSRKGWLSTDFSTTGFLSTFLASSPKFWLPLSAAASSTGAAEAWAESALLFLKEFLRGPKIQNRRRHRRLHQSLRFVTVAGFTPILFYGLTDPRFGVGPLLHESVSGTYGNGCCSPCALLFPKQIVALFQQRQHDGHQGAHALDLLLEIFTPSPSEASTTSTSTAASSPTMCPCFQIPGIRFFLF